jgi:hypothetical protein
MKLLFFLLFFLESDFCKVYFKEEFDGLNLFSLFTFRIMKGDWKKRWVISEAAAEDKRGNFSIESPKRSINRDKARGLKLIGNNKYHQISADIGKTVNFENKTLIFSFSFIQESFYF